MPKPNPTFWEKWKGKIAIATAAFALLTGAAGAVKAWPELVPLFPAHRGYVLEQVGDVEHRLGVPVNSLLRWREEDNRARLDNEIAGWQIGLDKEQEPQTRDRIKATIDRLKSQRDKVDKRIRKLGPADD